MTHFAQFRPPGQKLLQDVGVFIDVPVVIVGMRQYITQNCADRCDALGVGVPDGSPSRVRRRN
jgi:hypothetical protein